MAAKVWLLVCAISLFRCFVYSLGVLARRKDEATIHKIGFTVHVTEKPYTCCVRLYAHAFLRTRMYAPGIVALITQIIAHADVSSGARCLMFGLGLSSTSIVCTSEQERL